LSLGSAIVTVIRVSSLLFLMQQLDCRGEVVHIGSGIDDRVNLHAAIPRVSILGLVHLRISLPLFTLSGAEHCGQDGMNDRALPHRDAPWTEVGFDCIKDCFAKAVLLQQLGKGEDRGLIGASITDQLDASHATHGGHFDQGLLHVGGAERIPLQ
jgi:hypothetical protein